MYPSVKRSVKFVSSISDEGGPLVGIGKRYGI